MGARRPGRATHGAVPLTPARLILRGYGPLAGIVVVLLFLTLLVPSRPLPAQTGDTAAVDATAPGGPGGGTAAPTTPESLDRRGTTPGQDRVAGGPAPGVAPGAPATTRMSAPVATGRSESSGGTVAGTPAAGPTTTAGSAGPVPTTRPAGPAVVGGADCSGGALQDANTMYSPPCLHWTGTAGGNGGATSRGVTPTEIVVTLRESDAQSTDEDSEFAKKAKERGLTDTEADRARSRDALLEYFNSRYELYGRKVKLVTYKGRGSTLSEFGGAGQEEANADALRVAQEIGAFADLSATTQPYLDALVRQRVVSFGGLHLPARYYAERAPYAWGQLIDCTALVEGAVDLVAKRFTPATPARRAGSAAMRSQPRRFGLLVPDDPVYRSCIDGGRDRMKAAGITFTKEIRYGLDFAKMQQEAPNIVAQLKSAGVTTVVLVTDPALPYFVTGAATQQDYWPEWVVTGTVLTDVDVVGQFYDQDQWQFAAGQSFLADIFQGQDSESYRAYKAVRSDEPAITRDLYYFPLLMLFIGLQMAGPNLTPETFQAGMFAYPARDGSIGRWSFSPGDHTAVDDAREVFWDRNATSAFNRRPGRYVTLHGGRRFRGANWPVGAPPAPVPPPAAP